MYELTREDLIWNRATLDDGGSTPARGDLALSSLLAAHGLIMNGGVLHGVELLTAKRLEDAKNGYRYFELDEVANLLVDAKVIFDAGELQDNDEKQFDDVYLRVATDQILFDRFLKKLRSNPEDFSPIER